MLMVKGNISKEGCSGTYFPSASQSSPLVSGQGTEIIRVFRVSLRWMRTRLDHGFDFYCYTTFRSLPKKGEPKHQETTWISVGNLNK